ncbi:hypothetical protein T484DRAFT_1849105 [Baffinella frigidus]|nr:hypothetical protein T484DRAFT_1849105 [Cryptophyta sp. CCMP2293]
MGFEGFVGPGFQGRNTGVAHTLFLHDDRRHAGALAAVLREANQEIPECLMKFDQAVARKKHSMYGAATKDVDMSQKPTKIRFD